MYLEQKDELTTVLTSSAKLLAQKKEVVQKFARAHAELTEWINKNPEEAKKLANAELKEITKRKCPRSCSTRPGRA